MKFTLDEQGLERLLSSPDAERALTNIAEGIARDWERNDPRTKPGGHEPPTINVGRPTRERGAAVVEVGTPDPLWHIIEFGSINNEPYAPIRKSVENAGLKLKDRDQ